MAGAVMNKIWNLFGVDTNAEEEEENEEVDGYTDEY